MAARSSDEKDRLSKISNYIYLIKKQFECPICIDFFDSPVITNCQHAFCKKCIENFIGNKRSQSCPMCKKNINLRSLNKFGTMEIYVEKAKKLIESHDREVGNNNYSNDTSKIFSSSNEIQQTDALNQSAVCQQKRKRSTSDEIEASKKKKSQSQDSQDGPTSSSNKKTNKKIKKQFTSTTNIEPLCPTNDNMDKVNEWLKNTEHINPFDSNANKNKNEITATKPSCSGISLLFSSEGTSSNLLESTVCIDSAGFDINSKLPAVNKYADNLNKNDVDTTNKDPEGNEKLRLRFPSTKDFRKQFHVKRINPLKFQKADASNANAVFTVLNSESNIKGPTKLFKSLINRVKSKNLLKDSSKSTPLLTSTVQSDPQLFQEPALPEATPITNSLKQQSKLTKTSDQQRLIELKKSQQIKFYYRGNLKQFSENNINLSKKNSSTNTKSKILIEVSTQTENDVLNLQAEPDYLNKFDQVKDNLIEIIFQELELDLAQEMVENELAIAASNRTMVLDTPERQQKTKNIKPNVDVITDTYVIPSTYVPQNNYNHLIIPDTCVIQNPNNILCMSQRSGLESSQQNTGEKKGKKLLFKRDRLPTIELLAKQEDSGNKFQAPSTPKSHLKRFKQFNDLIVVDTPVKSEDLQSFKELDETLHKSASRVEFVDSRILENSNSRFESFEVTNNRTRLSMNNDQSKNFENTMPYEHTDINETAFNESLSDANNINKADTEISPNTDVISTNGPDPNATNLLTNSSPKSVITSTTESKRLSLSSTEDEKIQDKLTNKPIEDKKSENQETPPEHKAHETTNKCFEKPLTPKKRIEAPLEIRSPFQDKTNQNFLDSMNITIDNNATFMKPSAIDNHNQLPPPAADILGMSYMSRDSMNSFLPTNASYYNAEEPVFKVPTLPVSKPDSLETQLLTDSELYVIDNLCKDMYSQHNQTLDGSEPINNELVASSKKINRIEFVCSLLKPDMKDVLKRFAKFIKATVADDVTETTTHLVVESDKHFICGVTSKYLKAISRKIWIVSIIWILQSVNHNKLLDPIAYEIRGDGIFGQHNGPKLSRQSTTDLFGNYEFLFIGKFETDSINLASLIKFSTLNGAVVVGKAKDFSDTGNKIRTVLFDEKVHKISVKNANFMLETAKIFSVTSAWFLDSLACYSIRDMKLYALYKED